MDLWVVAVVVLLASCVHSVSGIAELVLPFADVHRTNVPPEYLSLDSLELQLKFARIVRTRVWYDPLLAGAASPVAVIGQIHTGLYDDVAAALAGRGFVACTVLLEGQVEPDDYGRDLAFVLRELAAEGNVTESPLYGKVGRRAFFMGHGAAGEAVALAARRSTLFPEYALPEEEDLEFTGYVALAPLRRVPAVFGVFGELPETAAVLVVTGEYDCVFPANRHGLSLFAAVVDGACRTYIEVAGATHCLFPAREDVPLVPSPSTSSSNAACSALEAECGAMAPLITRSQARALLLPLLLDWFSAHATSAPNVTAWSAFYGGLQPPPVAGKRPLTFYMDCSFGGTFYSGVRVEAEVGP